MRRALLLSLLLAACDTAPAAPSAADWSKLDADAKCKAIVPRAGDCADELITYDLRGLDGADELRDAVSKKFADSPRAPARERARIVRASCAGNPDLADDVFACWTTSGCDALIACMTARHAHH